MGGKGVSGNKQTLAEGHQKGQWGGGGFDNKIKLSLDLSLEVKGSRHKKSGVLSHMGFWSTQQLGHPKQTATPPPPPLVQDANFVNRFLIAFWDSPGSAVM